MITSLGPAQALLLLEGIKWTILLSLAGFIGGGIVGFAVALCRASESRLLRVLAAGYIEIFRGTPLLMQLFLVYYGVALFGYAPSAWVAVAIGLTLNASAFLGEIWRGSIQAIPRGQTEAAAALGLHYTRRMQNVVLPQALRMSVPSTIGFMVQLIKGTSLAAIIGFTELSRTGQMLANITYQPLLVYAVVGALYFLLCWPISIFGKRIERKLAVSS